MTFALFGSALPAIAQVRVPFTQRTSQYTPTQQVYHVKGDFNLMGNTNLTLQNYGVNTQNGNNTMRYVDVDSPDLLGASGVPTFNSSAATLTMSNENGAVPECSNIIYAGLYWTGRANNSNPGNLEFSVTHDGYTKTFDKRKIHLKGPSSPTYTEFTASSNAIYYPTNMDDWMYSAYAEVTDYVRTNGIGEYLAADIALVTGNGGGTGYYGGWGMVVVYENSMMNYRDITLFDGHAFVQAQIASFDIPVSGFNTIQGGPVGVKMGVIAGEGDKGIPEDYFKIQKLNTTNYMALSHSGNTDNNFFNSSIVTGGNARNPNLVNNTGLDISMFNIPNPNNTVIGNNQTSTTFRYGSAGDTYIIFAVAMAVDAYIPEAEGIVSAVSINGAPAGPGPYTAQPGQELEYKVQLRNRGTEAINNTKITIPVPYNTTYITGSAATNVFFTPGPTPNTVTYEPTEGANGSLNWNFGILPVATNPETLLAEMTFKFRITENCVLLANTSCANVVSVNGTLTGKGAITGVNITDAPLIRGYTTTGVCQGVTIPGPLCVAIDAAAYVNQNCSGTPQITAFVFCDAGETIPVTEISGGFPTGTLFYNQYPVTSSATQFTITNPFIATNGISTYFAVPPGNSGCYYQFTIAVSNSTAVPVPENDVYWVGATASPISATATIPTNTLYYYTSPDAPPQLSITPSTEEAGVTTYYVAEGPTPTCIGPLVPLTVTVYPYGQIIAPNNMILLGCGTAPLTQLVYSEVPVSISVAQFNGIGGTLNLNPTDCQYFISYSDVSEGICPLIITRTFLLTDSCGFSTTVTQTITIGNNTAPVFQPLPAPTTISCGATPTFHNAVAIDDCAGVSATTFVDVTTPGACPGSYSITRTWTAVDACGNVATASQTITVADTVAPVLVTPAQSIVITCSQGINTAISNWLSTNGGATATDNCSSVTWSNNFVPTSFDCSTPMPVIFTATDACGNITTTTATITSQDLLAPVAPAAPANINVACMSQVPEMIPLTAVDNCEGNIITMGNDVVTPGACANSYSIVRTWVFADACKNMSSVSQLINVSDQSAPVAPAPPANINIACISQVPAMISLTAVDNCEGNITVSGSDVVTAGTCANSFSIVRTWVFADACNNSTSISQLINVSDQSAPVFNQPVPLSVSVSCGNIPPAAILTATDNCNSSVPVNFIENTAAGICAGSSIITRSWTASDACGNQISHSQIITVSDNEGPQLVGTYDSEINITCEAVPNAPDLQFTDNCSTVASVNYTEVIGPEVNNSYQIIRTWVVADGCGNASNFVQTINVTESPEPVQVPGYAACNTDIGLTLDLNDLLPGTTPTGGTFTDVQQTGNLQGSVFSPNGLTVGNYVFSYEVISGLCPETVEITIAVDDDCFVAPACSILVHNAMSPNNDGQNEVFIIENIENTVCFPSNQIEIYNRWGVLVYETSQYNNNDRAFRGYSEGRVTVDKSSALPTGTYFYLLQYTTATGEVMKEDGYLYLSR